MRTRSADSTLLRVVTCGSVDDGKSTLIGRMLFETNSVHDDQLVSLARDSAAAGTQGAELDFALLLDGLLAEREQGITIDVAYRFFSTARRTFIVADTPGHEQYTRNTATGASTADLAILLVDARKGLLTQTYRHSFIVSLLGIRRVVLAINKMDLVGYDQSCFEQIEHEYRSFAEQVGIAEVMCIPVSALRGDNVTTASVEMPWYSGPTLLDHLESVPSIEQAPGAFRMAVQWVNRPSPDFRGVAGLIASGVVRPGDRVRVLPSGVETVVDRIVTMDGDLPVAGAGRSVTLTFADEIDASRGDLICEAAQPAEVADQLQAHVVWMHEAELLPGRSYLLKLGTRTVGATFAAPRYRLNVNTLEHLAAATLQLNEVGVCDLHLDRPVAFDPYTENRQTGGFIVIDRMTNATVGAGMVKFALRRAHNLHRQAVQVDKRARQRLNGHDTRVLWFTGLSGSGKSTIANEVESRLHAAGIRTYLLDGDNVRHGLNHDLGFTDADRVENVRRVAEVAKLMADAGLVVLVSFISPFTAERRFARSLLDEGEFVEVFVDVPLAVAEARDPKGLYAKARRGELVNFTGIDSPYEPPVAPEIRIDATTLSPAQAAEAIIERLGL
ncbi:MAG: sulfate adenylyltransferase subunit CysN [Ilumatobacteraceae bacterium]